MSGPSIVLTRPILFRPVELLIETSAIRNSADHPIAHSISADAST